MLIESGVLSSSTLTDGDDFAGIYALSSNDIKVGTSIEVDGAPWRVLGIPSFFLRMYGRF